MTTKTTTNKVRKFKPITTGATANEKLSSLKENKNIQIYQIKNYGEDLKYTQLLTKADKLTNLTICGELVRAIENEYGIYLYVFSEYKEYIRIKYTGIKSVRFFEMLEGQQLAFVDIFAFVNKKTLEGFNQVYLCLNNSDNIKYYEDTNEKPITTKQEDEQLTELYELYGDVEQVDTILEQEFNNNIWDMYEATNNATQIKHTFESGINWNIENFKNNNF